MPFWLLITLIVVFWLVALLAIIMFMMGASRSRAQERAEQRAQELAAPILGMQASAHQSAPLNN